MDLRTFRGSSGSPIAAGTMEVVDRLGAFAEVGATRAYLQPLDLSDLDHVRLIGAEVIPQISEKSSRNRG